MRLVVVESPYAGDVEANTDYARRCVKDALSRGEAPLASHLLYTQVLDDEVPEERYLGVEAGMAWIAEAEASVVYLDLGLTTGMLGGILRARDMGIHVELRGLDPEVQAQADHIVNDHGDDLVGELMRRFPVS